MVNPMPPPGIRVVPLPHATEVNEPHVPENNSIYGVPILPPTLLNVIVGKADVAVKEYQTSAPGALEQALGTAGLETVAPASVPAGPGQEPTVKFITPEQLSFAGGDAIAGSTIHKVKSVVEVLFVVTLT